VTVVFFGLRLSGDPVLLMLGESPSQEAVDALRNKLGLNEPLYMQYLRYAKTVAVGDFGESIREHRSTTEVVFERIPATLQLATVSLFVTLIIGISIGVFAALNRNSPLDRFVMAIS